VSLWSSLRHTPAFWFVAGMLTTLFAVLLVQVYLVIEHAQPVPIAPRAGSSSRCRLLPACRRTASRSSPTTSGCAADHLGGAAARLYLGRSGQLPYQGSLRDALAAAGLPQPLVDKFAAMRDGALVGDRLEYPPPASAARPTGGTSALHDEVDGRRPRRLLQHAGQLRPRRRRRR
jgi:hypothetical protein